jgi:tripartite-type tricarboxylate transporter receptor subunit TctC
MAASAAVVLVWPAAASAAQAARYPVKAIRMVNPFTPGGSVDIVARAVSQRFNEAWGQPVIVDNRPGAGTTIGTALVARAVPDGYTLLTTTGTIAVNASLYQNLTFDVTKDLAPVSHVVQTPSILAVNLALPVKSVQEFISLAKAKPGQLNFASSGAGTSTHLTMEIFRSQAKIDLLHVPYKGATPAIAAVLGGEVQAIFNPITAILPQARAGKMRALAISSTKRVELAPELPTVAESGLPGFEVMIWYAVFAPAGTPRTIVNQLNGEINRMLQEPESRQAFLKIGMLPVGGTPEALGQYLKAEIARYTKVVKETGLKPVD